MPSATDYVVQMQKMLALVKDNIRQAMNRAKSYANANRSFREFEEGEKVFLKVPSHSKSLISGECAKLSPRYCGPWLILKRIGKVAYKLELPQGCRVHPVFHVSRLKKFLHPGDSLVEGIVLFQEIEDNARRKPTRILNRGVMQVQNRKIPTVLVAWHGLPRRGVQRSFVDLGAYLVYSRWI